MKLLLIVYTLLLTFSVHAEEALPELKLNKIAPNTYLYKSFQNVENFGLMSSNGLVVFNEKKAFIIDTPWSKQDTKTLVGWIEKQGYKPAASISTHSHEDRTAGIQWLNEQNIPTYASTLTNELLARKEQTLATHSFEGPNFQLEDGLIEIFYPGGGHTIDNLVVWLPKSKLLFGGCFVRSLQTQGLGYTGEASIEQWPSSVEKVLLKYPQAELVIPGHGKLGDINLLTHTKQLAAAKN